MKKFSNITNQTVGQEPKVDTTKIDETTMFKVKVMNLMEQFLSIQTYGPVDRYLRAGSITIKGKELFAEALLSLLDEKTIKEQTKLLESLKSEVRDWETIDNKIDDLNSKMIGDKFKTNYKVNQLLERYGNDEEMLVSVVEEQSKRVSDVELLQSYKDTFGSLKLTQSTLERISDIYTQRISESNDNYVPLTLERIIEIVDETKDLTPDEQTKVALSMPMTACGLYVINMKSRHNITVHI